MFFLSPIFYRYRYNRYSDKPIPIWPVPISSLPIRIYLSFVQTNIMSSSHRVLTMGMTLCPQSVLVLACTGVYHALFLYTLVITSHPVASLFWFWLEDWVKNRVRPIYRLADIFGRYRYRYIGIGKLDIGIS